MKRQVMLVTGAAGQIGRSMLRLLRSLDVERRGLDLAPCPGSAEEPWLACDLAEPASMEALREFCRPVTHVIHLASRVTNSKDLDRDYGPQFRIEVFGTLNLLRALPRETRHVAYSSSMTVYGVPERLPVAEDHPLRPHCAYALCKLAGERHLAEFSRETGIPAAALRISSVYGPGPARRSAVGAMIERASRGAPPEVFGDGKTVRDYIYVDDVCGAALAAALHGLAGPVIVGTGRGTSALELASSIARLAGLNVPPRLVPRELDDQATAGMVFDVRRLAGATRFSPSVSLEEGLARTLAYFRERQPLGKEET